VIETSPSLEFGLGSFSVMGWAKVRMAHAVTVSL
jgi:hypothetical protein